MMHEVGEEVRIIKDLNAQTKYDGLFATSWMMEFAGKKAKIGWTRNDRGYVLMIDGEVVPGVWTDSMLEPVEAPAADDNPYWANITKIAQSQRRKGLETYGHPLEDFQTPDTEERIRYIEEELVDALMYLEWLKDRK